MSEWVIVETELGCIWAANFLSGVLVSGVNQSFSMLHRCLFIEGYRVKMKTGDMDHNKLVRR